MNTLIGVLNEAGQIAVPATIALLAQTALLASLLLAIDLALARRVRAVVRHALWLLLPVKLLLPPGLAVPTSPAFWLASADHSGDSAMPQVHSKAWWIFDGRGEGPHENGYSNGAEGTPGPRQPQLSPGGWWVLLWGAGSVSFLVLLGRRFAQVRHVIRHAAPVAEPWNEWLESASQTLHGNRLPRLLASSAVATPSVCGLLRPVILIPSPLIDGLTEDQARAVLLHELAHLKRGDLVLNHLQAILQAVYFWNPAVWIACARMRRVREEAVDEAVVVALKGEAESYAATLVHVARNAIRRPSLSLGLVGILESGNVLRARVARLLRLPCPSRGTAGCRTWLALLVLVITVLPMAGGQDGKGALLIDREMPLALAATNGIRPQITMESRLYELTAEGLEGLGKEESFDAEAAASRGGWVLTAAQAARFVSALQQKFGKGLAAPRVTTLEGRGAMLKVDADSEPDKKASPRSFGSLSIELLPQVSKVSPVLQLAVVSHLTELVNLGPSGPRIDPSQPVFAINATGYIESSLTNTPALYDGQTVVLRLPVVESTPGISLPRKEHLLTIQLDLTDAAGNKIRREDAVKIPQPPQARPTERR